VNILWSPFTKFISEARMINRALETFLFLLLLGCTTAEAADGWAPMLSWVGKYPSDRLGKSAGLLDQPPIKGGLKKLLPKGEIAALARFAVEAPVRRIDDYIVVNKCLPHNCPSDMAVVVIDAKNEKLWAGFFTRELGRVSTRWYGSADDYSVLPDEIKKEFLSRHGD